ncbi:MAG: biotin--[acetyl-CoA-carboxylase] ligase [Candidatus Omnitrophica bacterium]|nr:biotin--[acetyl-CoA-carboxylase] ligase [Candidatus Omnitrophota bacterium]
MQDKVLEYLRRKTEYVSGEEMSEHLEFSRQALWKHIQALKDAGYDIEAVPHLGYKLRSAPDRLFPAELAYHLHTKFVAKKIYYYESMATTMDAAAELGVKGCPNGTLVVAESQTKGKGRLGREWFSPKHKGIYASLVLRTQLAPNSTPLLTLVSAVGICEAIKEATGLDARIKWPNDILINNKKLGGILTELNAETDQTHFVVVGFGLNINNDRKTLFPGSTSLKEQLKDEVNRAALLRKILLAIEENYLYLEKHGPTLLLDKWRSANITLGRRVKVHSHHRTLEGEAIDIDSDGALLLRNDSGLVQKVLSGDVVHCR